MPASADTGQDGATSDEDQVPVLKLVDPQASPATRSLFRYLQESRGKRILFGHQHATTEFIAVTGNPVQSDVHNATGDFPAIFGWDTLSIEGKEKPGISGNIEASRERLIEKMKEAHKLGGIVALSTHFPNFATGGNFYDTSVGAVEHILPGGSKNAEFNAMLDHVAYVANHLKDENGELIPILFRPFHEQNGSWFWWGARLTKTSDYIALYRYTVEYLRDRAGVRNFLYVFSPNGPFAGDEKTYLATYPGDEYVDILGMDQYDNQDHPGTKGFLNGLARDLAMINRLADAKGKIAALAEFGYSPQGMKTRGNGDLAWFTKVLDAIKNDPDARRTAYMQTWANFSTNGNLFVPYKNAALLGDHELLPDFIAFYEDEYTAFAGDLSGVYDRKAEAAVKDPFLHIATPTAGTEVVDSAVIRARVLHAEPAEVTFAVRGLAEHQPMTLDADTGYYMAIWQPDKSRIGGNAIIEVKASLADGTVLEDAVEIPVGSGEPPVAELLHDFESSDEGWTINNDSGGIWNTAGAAGPEPSTDAASSGGSSLKADFQLGGGSFELARVGDVDLSGALALEARALVRLGESADAGNGVRAKLYVKTGDSWAWTDSGEKVLDEGGFLTLRFDLSNVGGLEAVRAIGLQILTDPDSKGTASIWLDEVTLYRPAAP
ncbi:glycosyl hydrolase [Thermobacillus sp.]|uniref:glycosyl hydrolase n=1 Tax=Thermobacillus sp. TaxID=2108467 RepID=UPI00257AB64E|nr:glycosyl hydrolase [Thermobacillus sp.]